MTIFSCMVTPILYTDMKINLFLSDKTVFKIIMYDFKISKEFINIYI